ncbi:MAG TPA: ABC transporter ATP-binding protein [Trueperaceae bacterium]|nr:ABC transporter ATP-binding protein [Trueperaceae bacterium]
MSDKIVARNAGKTYPSKAGTVTALEGFDLTVADGEFVCLVGPSGCGKSTFLRILAGLDELTSGEARVVPGDDPRRPLNNVVFQEYAVFPWKTVIDNVAFGLQMRGIGRAERYEVAERWLGKVGLKRFARYYPSQISGGMKQRVSIARALANDPEVLLMDEPLGALDAQTRAVLQEELIRTWEETHKTVLYVTHSIEEAVLLGDRVLLMTAHPGTNKSEFLIDLPRPRDLATTATARFASLTGAIWEDLRDEVRRAMEAQA